MKSADSFHDFKMLNKQLETIIHSSFDEIFVADGNGKVLLVNPAGEALYGMSAKELVGKNAEDLAQNGLYSPSTYPIIKERKKEYP